LNQAKERRGHLIEQRKKSRRSNALGVRNMATINGIVQPPPPPICYKCKEEGHMCANCHSKARDLKMFGFAIPD
jgi:hypothetical protein